MLFKVNLKLAKMQLDRREFHTIPATIRRLHELCASEQNDEAKRGTQLLDVYALEIQLCTATKDNRRLKELYQASLRIRSAIPHPRNLGIIRECGGKMHIREGQWESAHQDFFSAFKSYDEAGSERRIQCLKYLVLANMLMKSSIDPFTASETKPCVSFNLFLFLSP